MTRTSKHWLDSIIGPITKESCQLATLSQSYKDCPLLEQCYCISLFFMHKKADLQVQMGTPSFFYQLTSFRVCSLHIVIHPEHEEYKYHLSHPIPLALL